MNERLKFIRKYFNLNQSELGFKVNLSRSHISSLENGAREITDRIIHDICREFNVNEDWLRTGKGEMFVQPKTFTLDEKAREHNLTDLEVEIMKNYMELDPHVREGLVKMLKKSFDSTSNYDNEQIEIDKEVESYRKELEISKKMKKSSVSDTQEETS